MSPKGRASSRAFTLIELMVVVIIIGVLAILAIPSMSLMLYDRDAYNDAGSIMGFLRDARTRAVGRGGAVLVSLDADPNDATRRGSFLMYEAVSANPGTTGGTETPLANCKLPTDWTLANLTPIAWFNMNGKLEQSAGITTTLSLYSGTNKTAFTNGYICYTPLGRSYVITGNGPVAKPTFDGQLPTVNPIEALVARAGGGTLRSVVVPPNGMARLFSHQ